jgi:uridine kinase
LDVFARSLIEAAGTPIGRPRIVAVDGRGGGGKTALAERLCRVMSTATIVHSDDVAWAHSRFGWDDLMIGGVLAPLHAGRPVRYRPPAWHRDGREGHIDVAPGASTVIIEGVGVSRRDLAPLIDVIVWVQSDFGEAKRRGVRRDMTYLNRDEDDALREWDEWQDEEVPFLRDDQPWLRAHVIVGTASSLPHNAESEVVVSPPLTRPGTPVAPASD